MTAAVKSGDMSAEQKSVLNGMQHITGRKIGMKPGAPGLGMGVPQPARPKTAACTTQQDEERT
jgi:hypothetical protein